MTTYTVTSFMNSPAFVQIALEDAILARMSAEKKYNYWLDRVFDQL